MECCWCGDKIIGKNYYYDPGDDEYVYCYECVHLNRKEF